jgi:TatD DNase family protein
VAIGEIGLDYFRNLSPPDVQRDAMDRQLAIAAQLDRPVLVHDRDAHDAVRSALLGWTGCPARPVRGVLHAFSGDAHMAAELVERQFVVSFALPLSFRSAVGPRAAAVSIGDDAFLVETDSPYLGPERNARNEPTGALRVIGELARLRNADPESVGATVRRTYDRLLAG